MPQSPSPRAPGHRISYKRSRLSCPLVPHSLAPGSFTHQDVLTTPNLVLLPQSLVHVPGLPAPHAPSPRLPPRPLPAAVPLSSTSVPRSGFPFLLFPPCFLTVSPPPTRPLPYRLLRLPVGLPMSSYVSAAPRLPREWPLAGPCLSACLPHLLQPLCLSFMQTSQSLRNASPSHHPAAPYSQVWVLFAASSSVKRR